MSIATPLTALLEIEHPILLAPMEKVADGNLAAAVSAAGGLGLVGGGYGDEAWLTREMDSTGGARVGVGFITWSLAKNPRLLDLALERKPPAVMLSFGKVRPHADKIRNAGARLVCQVQTLEQAKEALSCGADILVAQGAEAGGHGDRRGTFPLVPAIVDMAGGVPVVAAGGIADGRGLAAALMLGAAGVLVGTRFYATQESAAPQAAKERVVAATGDQTHRDILLDVVRGIAWPAPYTGRTLHNGFLEKWRDRKPELLRHLPEEAARYDQARRDGDYDVIAVFAGEVVDLIADIPPAADVVRRMAAEAASLLAGASGRIGGEGRKAKQ